MSLLAGLRTRRNLGELVVERDDARQRVVALEELAAAMIGCVQALVLDIDELGAAQLKTDLAGSLCRLRAGAEPPELAAETARRQHEALDFADRERRYLDRRDAELRRIIAVLGDGLAAVSQGSAAYHRRLLDNGGRLETASRLGDLVKMRAAIATEVAGLRKAVAERQAEETAATAALRREVETLRKHVEVARSEARTDPLTGAANRAAFDEDLERRCALAGSGGDGFALLLVDIDHFKRINDQYGHPVGDRVLAALVGYLRESVRRDDLIARWGGEEFAVILPSASARVALRKAKAMVAGLAGREWAIDGARRIGFTASIGVAAWTKGDDPARIVERVDQALYRAKRAGRNRAIKAT